MATKTATPTLKTATDAAEKYALACAEIAALEAAKAREQAELDAKYRPQMEAHTAEKEKQAATIEAYVTHNREEMFSDAKSARLAGLTVGFRSAPASLAIDEEKTNWPTVTTWFASKYPAYIRTKEELDKAAVIKDYTTLEQALKKQGVYLQQKESFYIK